MRIAFIDHYREGASQHKDPITIPRALAARGHAVDLVSIDDWQGTLFGLPTMPVSSWLKNGPSADAAVCISRFNPQFTHALREIKRHGIRLIVKGDTDGTLGYPLRPNYLRARPLNGNPANWLRHIKWRLPVGTIVRRKLEHVMLANVTVVESPGAAANLIQVLRYWGGAEKAESVRFIPNPVSKAATHVPVSRTKTKTILAIGRWDDTVKGGHLLRETIKRTLKQRSDYRFVIIGKDGRSIWSALDDTYRSHVECTGVLDFDGTQAALAKGRILLATSLIESFSFAAAEALCAGTSLAVTPIESLVYLAGGGAYGSISRGFTADAISAALVHEIQEWENRSRSPVAIASVWRRQLDDQKIASEWEKVLQLR